MTKLSKKWRPRLTEAETEIPQPAAPETVIPEVVLQLTDTPQPKLKNPFSKTPKFKVDDFFHEHVFFTDYNPYDSARLTRKRFWTASQEISILHCFSIRTKSSTMSIFLMWTWNCCLASHQSSVFFMTLGYSTSTLTYVIGMKS